MASRHPLSLGRTVLGIAPQEATIATALRYAGYKCAAFVAGNPYLTARYGYDQGFDEFHDFMDAAVPTGSPSDEASAVSQLNRWVERLSHRSRLTGASYDELYFWYCQWRTSRKETSLDDLRRYPAADVLMQRAIAWVKGLAEERFFLWIHLMDPHHPYYPPQEALSAVGASAVTARRARFLNAFWNRGDIGPTRWHRFRDDIITLYDAGIYWADKQIGRLVDTLRDIGRWDETAIAVTADHGEEFLEHGVRYHSPVHLPEELIQVPLLIRSPATRSSQIGEVFSHVDLAPTLLECVGTAVPETFIGSSRWTEISTGQMSAEPAVIECLDGCNNPFQMKDRLRPRLLAVRDHEHKLVIRFGENGDTMSSIKKQSEDPTTSKGLAEKKRAQFLRKAAAHLRASHNRKAEPELRARARELRYEIASERERS